MQTRASSDSPWRTKRAGSFTEGPATVLVEMLAELKLREPTYWLRGSVWQGIAGVDLVSALASDTH